MSFPVESLAIVGGFVVIVNRFVDSAILPIFDKFKLDHFWLKYVAWVLAGALIGLTGVNLFATVIQDPLVGQLLTAVVSGGGANILQEISGK